MPVIDGEKWACSSCIKGHRVSGCLHSDRELFHINPKGRPVKQCEHCRGARKSKSHHAKCDCGDKKDKHKDKGDAKGENHASASAEDFSNHAAASETGCCCHSGSKCICGVKKESLDLKLDTGKHTLHGARAKPKLTSTVSESTLTVFANGHHKPCHRNNNTAHVSGMPYKIPRPHTLHGPAAFAAFTQGSSNQRAMDTLSVSNNEFYTMFGSSDRAIDGLSNASLTSALDGTQDALFTSQCSTYGQDSNSPSESQQSDNFGTQQWPWMSSNVAPLNRNFGFGSLSTSPSQDCLPNLDTDWAIPSAGLNPWSPADLPLDPSKLRDSLRQPISHSGESKQSIPGLTTSSSTHSEIEESNFFGGDFDFAKNPPSAVSVSESLFWEDNPVFGLGTSAPSEALSAPTSMPTSTVTHRPRVDLEIAENDLNVTPVTMTSAADYGETRAIAMPNDDAVSTDPWMMDNNFGGFNTPDLGYNNWV
ncbi:hypothetical protein P154DRAFT_441394 [Amniculicola lignicola CBS 123094]|uniref:Copper-fist domain-containing protein n=1 Tax=Amniculicola lignicola CBS 123094 TaxID=1392246 RepID=A0A6A5W9B2_9PLEO|nr:hypothetical protein P154DRAFT_441394 [Amniculicola lignicola CBS 123094]